MNEVLVMFAVMWTICVLGTLPLLSLAFQPAVHVAGTSRSRGSAGVQVNMMTARVGDTVVAGNDWNSSSPEFGILRAQGYELRRIYYQGVADGEIRRVDVTSLDSKAPAGAEGYTKYLMLYSDRYHTNSGPVIVRPNEVNVITVRDEIADSAWLALPGLFWVWLAYTFYMYGVDHGFVTQRF